VVRGFRVLSVLIVLLSQCALLYGCKLGIEVAMQLPYKCLVFAMLPCMRHVIAMPTINNNAFGYCDWEVLGAVV
jgi:hypothetical protein